MDTTTSQSSSTPVITLGMARYMNESIFDFNNPETNKKYYLSSYPINDKIILNIKKATENIAYVYFTSYDLENILGIPDEVKIHSIKNDERLLQYPYPDVVSFYLLHSTDNYEVEYDGKIVLYLKSSNKKWDIYGVAPVKIGNLI
jgi:hypothetical protein